MIGGSSAGSGWSFFRSSSRDQVRRDEDTTSSMSPSQQPVLPTSAAIPHTQDGDTPQSGKQDLRSWTDHDDAPLLETATEDASSVLYCVPHPFDIHFALSSSVHEPPPSTIIQAPLPRSAVSSSSSVPVSPEDNVATLTNPRPSHHLHSLTERKLEKAVLGRAVGLRQLVLLSNAFATRPSPIPAISSDHQSLLYPYASTSQRTSFDDDDEIIDFEEDEAERKRREEDWLDSVLDEMLTDAEDEEDADKEVGTSRHVGTATRSEREFKEPYVHLSIKHGWQPYGQSTPLSSSASYTSAPPTLAAQHATMLAEDVGNYTKHLETSSLSSVSPLCSISEEEQWPSDSGFMEPCSVPLPESAEVSPHSSATSQISDDEQQEAADERLEYGQNVCEACEAASEDTWREQQRAIVDQHESTEVAYPQIGIPILPSTGATSLEESPHSFTSTSLPELAYSATSLNTLASCPSHSIQFFTPYTNPATGSPSISVRTSLSSAEREKLAWRSAQAHSDQINDLRREIEPQEIMLPIDDLDLYDDDREEDEHSSRSSREDGKTSSTTGGAASTEGTERSIRTTTLQPLPSLELVMYQSVKGKDSKEVKEDDALRIPLYSPLFTSGPTGLFSSRTIRSLQEPPSMPALPPSLLSVMMGKTPAVQVELQPSRPRDNIPAGGKNLNYSSAEAGVDKLRLPLFIPTEIVKSLYDSVDFGLPPRTSSPSSSPSQTPLVLPFEFPIATSTTVSKPVSRSRSKSLSLEEDLSLPTTTHSSPGGLLFSSLGLSGLGDEDFGRSATVGIWDQSRASQRRRSLSFNPPDTFAHASEEQWSGTGPGVSARASRNMIQSVTRNESRSPSRLRLFLDQGEVFADDFEFGSI